jgi:hypothetical protein
MAAESVGGISQVPEYVQYVAWTVITVVGALAVRFGWFSQVNKTPTTETQITGGMVDNRALKALMESVDDAVDEMKEMHREDMNQNRILGELLQSLGTDIRSLDRNLVRLFEKIH